MTVSIAQLRPDLFAIRLHGRRWASVQVAKADRLERNGWRRIVWTDSFADAEKFATQEEAEVFARWNLAGFRQNSQLTLAASTA